LAGELGVVLERDERRVLESLPVVHEDRRDDVSDLTLTVPSDTPS
jgi:hypothetical protein